MALSPNDSGSSQSQPIAFTSGSADRIAKVVRRVEQGRRDQLSSLAPAGGLLGQKVFRVCTFTGAWAIGVTKTVTFKYQANTPNTVAATNLFLPIPKHEWDESPRDCAIAKDGAAWFLLQVKWDEQPFVSSASLGTANLTFTRHLGVSLGTASTVAITTITCE
jgi:hypothetical protein